MQRRAQYILASLHLLVIIFWLGGSTLFVHSHIIDGHDIVHSHPYTGDTDDHGHTTDNILQINRLANVDMLAGGSSTMETFIPEVELSDGGKECEHISSIEITGVSLRAPPVRA